MSALTAKIMLELWLGKGESEFRFTIDDVLDFFKKDDRQKAKRALNDLRQQDLIKQKQNYDGSVLVSLSEKGKLRALNYVFKKFDNRREKWDGKWRMVIFDIPVYCTKGRKALVYRLKSAGFYELQNSIFLYPYDCKKEVNMLTRLFKIEKYVIFGLLDNVDNQERLLYHFKLN